jgi:hypothetical protein
MLRSIECHRVVPAENVIPLPPSYRFRVYMQCSRWRHIISGWKFTSTAGQCMSGSSYFIPFGEISVKMLKTE